MTEGRPDWHKSVDVDIIAQTLDKIMSTKAQGPLKEEVFDTTVSAGLNFIFDLYGPGVVMGGFLRHWPSFVRGHHICEPYIVIDGQTPIAITFENMADRNLFAPNNSLFYLTKYSKSEDEFICAYNSEWYFKSGFMVRFNEFVAEANLQTVLYWVDL